MKCLNIAVAAMREFATRKFDMNTLQNGVGRWFCVVSISTIIDSSCASRYLKYIGHAWPYRNQSIGIHIALEYDIQNCFILGVDVPCLVWSFSAPSTPWQSPNLKSVIWSVGIIINQTRKTFKQWLKHVETSS